MGRIGSTDLRIAGGRVKDHNYAFDHKSRACLPQFTNIECFKIFAKIYMRRKARKKWTFQGCSLFRNGLKATENARTM